MKTTAKRTTKNDDGRKTVLISAGPTREYLDPVRFISNDSSGTLGYEIARAAVRRGHQVILVSGPVTLAPISGARIVPVISANEMRRALRAEIGRADALFMTAAVADFTPARTAAGKMKRVGGVTLRLKKTADILAGLGRPAVKGDKTYIGFCLETSGLITSAQRKLVEKNLDYIVATRYKRGGPAPFGRAKFSPVLIPRSGTAVHYRDISKKALARHLVRLIR